MNTRTAEATQGVVALLGITLGAIPLVSRLLGGEGGGLLSWLLGGDGIAVPVVVTVVAVLLIGALELAKRTRT